MNMENPACSGLFSVGTETKWLINTKIFRLQRTGTRSPKRKTNKKAQERGSRALSLKSTFEECCVLYP